MLACRAGCRITSGRRDLLRGSSTMELAPSVSPARSGVVLRNSERIVATTHRGPSSERARCINTKNCCCASLSARRTSSSAWSIGSMICGALPVDSTICSMKERSADGSLLRRPSISLEELWAPRAASTLARQRARLFTGAFPGVIEGSTVQRSWLRWSRGSNPACRSDDLPLPEGPIIARSRLRLCRAGFNHRSSSSIFSSRPKKTAACLDVNADRPGKGGSVKSHMNVSRVSKPARRSPPRRLTNARSPSLR